MTANSVTTSSTGRVDVIVALGHILPQEGTALLKEAPEVAVVVEGHSHRGLDAMEEVDGRVRVGLRGYGVEVGRLDLEVDTMSHRTVSAASVFMPSRWPGVSHALVDWLREARLRCDLSSRARVVAWGDHATLAPLVEAGFEIGSVLSPAHALARVVRTRQAGAPAGTATAALSLNSHGGAIAIVSGTEVVQSRVFEWPLGTPFTRRQGPRAELLDRYLLVSQVAPQLKHVIDLVRLAYGVRVTSIVACGNLPNLRSLAMLLIEELDIEVETLDSAELLEPSVVPGTLADTVASLQLAAAVASPGESRVPVHADFEPAQVARTASDEYTPGRVRPVLRLSNGPGARLQSVAAFLALAFCTSWSFMQVYGQGPARPIFPGGLDQVVAAASPDLQDLNGLQEPGAEATTGHVAEPAPATETPSAVASSGHGEEAPVGTSTRPRIPHRASQAGPPLPSVDGIMIAGPHRLAIVGGTVVAAGDPIGSRAIARIERDGVVLREASGKEVYVAIRLRKPPTLGS
jgi:hypothetical protein